MIKDPAVRRVLYWAHVITPLLVVWLFVLHRLAGRRIKWKVGLRWAAVAAVFARAAADRPGPGPAALERRGAEAAASSTSSLARAHRDRQLHPRARCSPTTAYCQECHPDIHDAWSASVHRFSSFNNPAYLFSVRETRKVSLERDGNVQASRWCAGCHDPVPFSQRRVRRSRTSTTSNDPAGPGRHHLHGLPRDHARQQPARQRRLHHRGAAPLSVRLQREPDRCSGSTTSWSRPSPSSTRRRSSSRSTRPPSSAPPATRSTCRSSSTTTSSCAARTTTTRSCSPASPATARRASTTRPRPQANCTGCHMPLRASDDFGAKDFDGTGKLTDPQPPLPGGEHRHPAAGRPAPTGRIEAHRKFNEGVDARRPLRRARGRHRSTAQLLAPLRPAVPALAPRPALPARGRGPHGEDRPPLHAGHGRLERGLGRPDGQERRPRDRPQRRPGRRAAGSTPGRTSSTSTCSTASGNRIDRRNPQDIFVPLYNHQIPPGAADVVHYLLEVPADAGEPITVEAKLRYRKFDTTYMQHVYGAGLHERPAGPRRSPPTRVTFPVAGARRDATARSRTPRRRRGPSGSAGTTTASACCARAASRKGELRAGRGGVPESRGARPARRPAQPGAASTSRRARSRTSRSRRSSARRASTRPPPPWSLAWFTGLVNKQNGNLDEAIANFQSVAGGVEPRAARARLRLQQGLQPAQRAGPDPPRARQAGARRSAAGAARRAAARVGVVVRAHARASTPRTSPRTTTCPCIRKQLGDEEPRAASTSSSTRSTSPTTTRATAPSRSRARADPAANHAAEAIVIYDLQRPGAFELPADAYADAAGGALGLTEEERKDPSATRARAASRRTPRRSALRATTLSTTTTGCPRTTRSSAAPSAGRWWSRASPAVLVLAGVGIAEAGARRPGRPRHRPPTRRSR